MKDSLDLEIVSQDLNTLRDAVYEIVTPPAEQNQPDISQNQSMGVALTNSMKKEGVNIIQIQQTVNVHVISTSVKALKIIDNIQGRINSSPDQDLVVANLNKEIDGLKEQLQIAQDSMLQLEEPRIITDAMSDISKAAFEEKMNLEELNGVVRKAYLTEICNTMTNTKDIADLLGVSTSGVSAMKRKFRLTKRRVEDDQES